MFKTTLLHSINWRRFFTAIAVAIGLFVLVESHPGGRSVAQERQDRLLKHEQSGQKNPRRVALIIGNGAYTRAPALKNPPHDAALVAATLKKLGFEVTAATDKSQREMKQLIREFGRQLRGGGAVGLFYFAGHGVQAKGHNYLIPVEADIQSDADLEVDAVDLDYVLNVMDDAQNDLNIVILDACRNNPFARGVRSAGNGLAPVEAPTGTLIAYATAPGRTASDGPDQNGLYTAELLKQIRVPGLSLLEMFMKVRVEVMRRTSGKQVPWEASSLVRPFYFSMGNGNAGANTTGGSAGVSEAEREETLWNVIKDSSDPQPFRNFLAKFPNGIYADAAELKLRRLEASKPERKKESVTSSLGPKRSISIGSTGNVPGLDGRLNPILDSGRNYLYADNIAIEGGKVQPVKFVLNEPFQVEDSKGNRFELTITHIDPKGATIAYQKLESTGVVSDKTEIRVIDQSGSAVRSAQLLVLFEDSTFVEATTDREGKARIGNLKRASATIFCAHSEYASYKGERNLGGSFTIQLPTDQNKGSIIIANGTGYVPGLEGRLNPILGDQTRKYIYASDILIEGGKAQPYRFTEQVPFSVVDKRGSQFTLEVISILGSSSLIEFRKM